jgi:hypothetical protein
MSWLLVGLAEGKKAMAQWGASRRGEIRGSPTKLLAGKAGLNGGVRKWGVPPSFKEVLHARRKGA